MQKIYDEYRFVKLTRKVTYRLERKENIGIQSTGYLSVHPSTAFIKRRYLKRYPLSSPSKIQRICRNCIKKGYLESVKIENGQSSKIDGLCTTDKADEFLDRALWIVPIGLWEAWWEKHSKLVTGLVGFVSGVAGASILIFIKWVTSIS